MFISTKLKYLTKCAARESTRYAIASVCLSREKDGKCRAQATDGCRLIDVHWTDINKGERTPPPFQVLVPLRLWELALREDIALDNKPHVGFDETAAIAAKPRLIFDCGEYVISGKPCEGTFPNTDGMIPKYKADEGMTIGVDPRLWAEMESVFGALEDGDRRKPACQFVAPNRPMVMSVEHEGMTVIGAIMPVNLQAK